MQHRIPTSQLLYHVAQLGKVPGGGPSAGPSSKRPVLTAGQFAAFLDTTLGRFVFWNGTAWVFEDGTPAP